MKEELEVLKGYVESLGLHEKKGIDANDHSQLLNDLEAADEYSLAGYVERLNTPSELEDFIKYTLYAEEA